MHASLFLAAALILSAPAPKDSPKTEGLDGEWQVITAETNGKAAPADRAKALRVVFEGDTMTITSGDRQRKKTARLDPAKLPKQMDLFSLDGQEKGETAACIYSLEKGQLKLCMPYFTKDPGKRPTEFKTKDGDGLMLMVLERVKGK